MKCRICGSENLDLSLSLGEMYVSDFVKDLSELKKMPMEIFVCDNCGLEQIGETPELDSMYKKYWYKSGINASMINDLREIATSSCDRLNPRSGDVVCDIGANDGTLLDCFPWFMQKVGFDPALSVKEQAGKICDVFVNDYFSADKYPKDFPKAKIITAIAMFYDLPDPNKFVEDMKEILADDGIIVLQFTDLLSTIKLNDISNLCFEHIEVYKLYDIVNLFDKHGMSVFHVEYNLVNGGSLRVYISKGCYPINPSVPKYLQEEFIYLGENNLRTMQDQVLRYKDFIREYISPIKKMGKSIYALGASTKGSTLLQVLNLGPKEITAIGEINPDKFGLITVTGIPIISEKECFL